MSTTWEQTQKQDGTEQTGKMEEIRVCKNKECELKKKSAINNEINKYH